MELYISETIRKYRKQLDLTQEQLAANLGVSPQSVSKWECNDGYPDITLLPNIANYFQISIDELLGNDQISKRNEIIQLDDKFWDFESDSERVDDTLKLFRKYPHDWEVASMLSEAIALDRGNLSKNMPLLRETCDFLLNNTTDYYARHLAAMRMCMCCPDDEIDKWFSMISPKYSSTKYEILESRLWEQGKLDESREMFRFNSLRILLHFLCRVRRNVGKPQMAVEWYSQSLKIIEVFSENGKIPRIWLGFYADTKFRLACAEFGLGENESGYAHLEEAFELYPKWLEIPTGTVLGFENPIFGDIKAEVRGDWYAILSNGEKFPIVYTYVFQPNSSAMYSAMTCEHGWEWFDGVRNEPKFKDYVARAKEIMEKYR